MQQPVVDVTYDSYSDTLEFTFQYGSCFNVYVIFRDSLYPYAIKGWHDFVKNIKNGVNDELAFCQSNGYVGMSNFCGSVTFNVEKSGVEGDGNINVEVDGDLILPVLEKAITLLENADSNESD